MRIVIVLFVMVAGCTKQNPQACCTDAVDCMNVGLPEGTGCDDGLLCRGNRCVEEPCASSGQCDVTAPYCVMSDEGRCAESCNADSQCPGFAQEASDQFCVSGGCVQCRAGMTDCPVDKPLCNPDGACVACVEHIDCPSGVCANGTCAAESQIAFVATNGAPASDCTKASPCNSAARALAVTPPRPYVVIDSGTYSSPTATDLNGVRWLIGRGASRPVLTRSTDGPILRASTGSANVKLEHLEVFGARGMVSPDLGIGIVCSFGASTIALEDVALRMNSFGGVSSTSCSIEVRNSLIEGNGHAAELIDSNGDFDRCTVIGNTSGLNLDGGVFHVTNSMVARNGYGISLYSTGSGNTVLFNTIVDNGGGSLPYGGFECNVQGAGSGMFENNIYARNNPIQVSGPCNFGNSITATTDIGPLKFVRPDSPPYDYHIQAGSSAVDLAGASPTIKVDIDGESRPFGDANDIGADELH